MALQPEDRLTIQVGAEVSYMPVSVIIPTYNRAAIAARAVRSVMGDCRPGDEIIVVDDGSTDCTESEMRNFVGQIVYFRIPHGGAGKARNFGVSRARNPLVAFLDSDDEWIAGNLDLKRNLMQSRPDLVFCWSDFASVDDEGHLVHTSLSHWHRDPRSWDDILGKGIPISTLTDLPDGNQDCLVHIGSMYATQLLAGYVAALTIVVRKQLAGDALFFAEDLSTYEDWLCFANLARVGPCAYLDCETGLQHRHRGPRLTDADTLVCATTTIAILERVWGRDPQFLVAHGSDYQRALGRQRLRRIRALLSSGRPGEARNELNRLVPAPLLFRLLTYCPGRLLKAASASRRTLREKLIHSAAHS